HPALHCFPTRRSSDLLFNLSGQTQANSLQAQGHAVVACRVSTVQHVEQALTLTGLTFDGNVIFFGHAGVLRIPGTSSYYSLLSIDRKSTRLNSSHVKI